MRRKPFVQKKAIISRIAIAFSVIALSCYSMSRDCFAQEAGKFGWTAGLAAAYSNSPEATDYEDSGGNGEVDKFDLFLDFGTIRLGVNTMHGLNEDESPEQRLRANTFYLVYRARAYEESSKLDAYLMGGLAMISSAIHKGDDFAYSSDDYGYILGAGASYYFIDPLGFGLQIIKISGEGELGDNSLATGSTQIQMIFLYPF